MLFRRSVCYRGTAYTGSGTMKTLSNCFQIANSDIKCLENNAWEGYFCDIYDAKLIDSVIINLPHLKDEEDFL